MIENHVVSLELSKRLHELGIDNPSIFTWICRNGNCEPWFGEFDDGFKAYLYLVENKLMDTPT